MWIKEKVLQLKEKYKTSDPFLLSTYLNIIVIVYDLHPEINGYYKYDRRNKYIVINSNLSFAMQLLVCAHELGHAILHPRLNTPFMRRNTFLSVDKIEREANRFAAELLIPDDTFYECETIYDVISLHNIPIELAQLKYQCCKENFFSI